jgi:hypothetical protein
MSFLLWLESTSIGTFVREGQSLLAYPTFTVVHTVGLSIVVGISGVIGARLAGLAPTLPLAPLRRLFPIIWFGFALNLMSGSGLAMASAAKTVPNPFFLTKIFCVIVAIVILRMLQVRVFRDPDVDNKPLESRTRLLGMSLLFLWVIAMIAGRLIGYSVDLVAPV